jgi:hypothetical protein
MFPSGYQFNFAPCPVMLHCSDRFRASTRIFSTKKTPWPDSATELCVYRPSNRRLSAKFVPTFADRVVNVTDPYGRILAFLDRSCYLFFRLAPQLYSEGWVHPVPNPLLLRISGSAGNLTRTSGSVPEILTTRSQSILYGSHKIRRNWIYYRLVYDDVNPVGENVTFMQKKELCCPLMRLALE